MDRLFESEIVKIISRSLLLIVILTIFPFVAVYYIFPKYLHLLEEVLSVYTSITASLIAFIGVAYSINRTLTQNNIHLKENHKQENIKSILNLKKENLSEVRRCFKHHLKLSGEIHKELINDKGFENVVLYYKQLAQNFIELKSHLDSESELQTTEIDIVYMNYIDSISNFMDYLYELRIYGELDLSQVRKSEEYVNYLDNDAKYIKLLSDYICETEEELVRAYRKGA